MNTILWTLLLSILPISELRGGIPFALANGVPWGIAFLCAVLANILVVPLVYFFLDYVHKVFLFIPWYKTLFNKIVVRTRKKIDTSFQKYEYWALFLFVAIPLPITGAYTGTLAAWLLGVPRKKAFVYLSLGVVVAGMIVLLVSVLGIQALQVFVREI